MAVIHRRAITLFEVVIVIVILTIASGVAAIGINKALIEQRFLTEVGLIVDEMRLAQDLMLILGTDVHLHFAEAKKKDGIEYWLEFETHLPRKIQNELLRKKKPLKAIKGVFLEDKLLWEIQESHIEVKFLSKGDVMSKGIMRLATSSDENVPSGTLESFICLSGYPRTIVSSRTKEEAEKGWHELEDSEDAMLTKNTLLKLPEKLTESDAHDKNEKSEKNQNRNRRQKNSEGM